MESFKLSLIYQMIYRNQKNSDQNRLHIGSILEVVAELELDRFCDDPFFYIQNSIADHCVGVFDLPLVKFSFAKRLRKYSFRQFIL